jgi:DNA-binding transcriptional MocR family regulator
VQVAALYCRCCITDAFQTKTTKAQALHACGAANQTADMTAMPAQVILSELLQHWGDAGLEAHVRKTQQEYWRRASALHEAAEQVRTCYMRPQSALRAAHLLLNDGSHGSNCMLVAEPAGK